MNTKEKRFLNNFEKIFQNHQIPIYEKESSNMNEATQGSLSLPTIIEHNNSTINVLIIILINIEK